jgi:hypothetical protein
MLNNKDDPKEIRKGVGRVSTPLNRKKPVNGLLVVLQCE